MREGLKNMSILNWLEITKIERWNVMNITNDQPPQWTAVYFQLMKDNVDNIVNRLSEALKPNGWFINLAGEDNVFVIFPQRVFTYKKGDTAKRNEAIEYGLQVGIPVSQLDWNE